MQKMKSVSISMLAEQIYFRYILIVIGLIPRPSGSEINKSPPLKWEVNGVSRGMIFKLKIIQILIPEYS